MDNVIHPHYLDFLTDNQISGVKKIQINQEITKDFTLIKANFIFNNKEYHISYSVPLGCYEGAKKSQHSLLYNPHLISDDSATQIWVESLIFEKSQEIFYRNLLNALYEIKVKERLSNDEYLELLVAYVQSLPYDSQRSKLSNPGIKYPIETAVDGTGICSDKSLLLAGLLSCSGYAVSILTFGKEKHMMVGLPVPDELGTLNTGIAFIETTTPSIIGMHLETNDGYNYHFTKPSGVYDIGHGKLVYGASSIIPYLSKIMNNLEEEVCNEQKIPFFDLIGYAKHQNKIDLYNSIVSGSVNLSKIQKEISKLGFKEFIKK